MYGIIGAIIFIYIFCIIIFRVIIYKYIIYDGIIEIIEYFKMLKEFGWKKTREYYKNEKKELEKYLDPHKEERKAAIKRFFE